MAKKYQKSHTISNQDALLYGWQNTLPPVYRPLAEGISAHKKISSLKGIVGIRGAIPNDLANLPIACLTPKITLDWRDDFFGQHVDITHSSLALAMADEDIQNLQRPYNVEINPNKPTLAAVVGAIHTLHAGYVHRMGEKLRFRAAQRMDIFKNDPKIIKQLKRHPFVQQNEIDLDNIPEFDFLKLENILKSLDSTLRKAYNGSGKPDKYQDFIHQEKLLGLNGVDDYVRVMIAPIGNDDATPKQRVQNYNKLFPAVTALLATGVIGIVAKKEITDSVFHPISEKSSDLIPLGKMKASASFNGPYQSLLNLNMEILLNCMDNKTERETRAMYEESRKLPEGDPQRMLLDYTRKKRTEACISEEALAYRLYHLETSYTGADRERHPGYIDPDHPIGRLLHDNAALICAQSAASKETAKEFAYNEYVRLGLENGRDMIYNPSLTEKKLVAGQLPIGMIQTV